MDKSIGSIGWFDLTVPNADEVKDFYAKVVGWKPQPVSMGDYNDYNMTINDIPKAGVCNKKGQNAHIPSQWMMYINVANIEESAKAVENMSGKMLSEIKHMKGYGKYCFIQDPAGAVCALFEHEQE